ncbi:TetR/AcrR family transcriptional regulator [Kineosporia sp. J2-2]|uniref:TetR/AcrR family transcriptional regulator n=1 Tax=Kineosporia corallincola TaxID=2835133 RepID=A0ABS5TK29_9ACTN|nr:TetR/AcrR family transcriptional regulator [Kineosporia corallincola]MBT0770744.1 TetR/AcrR family transcriptional regulator [Kineosporia corallincola]
MGLRERNAARTRETIIDTALSLFLERGYEATKMEDIAEAAGIGTSTLYRYFPTKDLLIIEPLAFRGKLVESLNSRPADEPLDIALGHVMTELFLADRGDPQQLRQIQQVVNANPAPRMRLLEEFVSERVRLEAAIAERLDRPPHDVFCVMTARLTTSLLEYMGDLAFRDEHDLSEEEIRELFRSLARQIEAEPPVFPVLREAF